MPREWASRVLLAVVGCAIAGFLTACAERQIVASVADQTFVPGPPPPTAAASVQSVTVVSPPSPAPAVEVIVVEEIAPVVEGSPSAIPQKAAQASAVPTSPPPSSTLTPAVPSPSVAAGGSFADVYFDFDQFLIRPDARPSLEADAQRLRADGAQRILIEGHCDERGTLAYNLVLGERRARAVQRYLRDLGVPASQLAVASYGKERPFCTDHNEACWQSNRRAHFRQP